MSSETPSTQPSWRFDSITITLLVVWSLITSAVMAHSMVAEHPFGSPVRWLAEQTNLSLGFGDFGLIAAGWILLFRMMRATPWWRWSIRLLGWSLFVPFMSAWAHQIETGQGGMIGAAIVLFLQSQITPPWYWVVLSVATLTAVSLLAPSAVYRVIRGMRWGCILFARLLGLCFEWVKNLLQWFGQLPIHAYGYWRRLSERREVVAAIPPPAEVKLFTPAPVMIRPEPTVTEVSIIPIHHHNEPPIPTIPDVKLPYELPPLTLLDEPVPFPHEEHDERLRERASQLEKTFADFGLKVKVVGIHTGPVITQYEISLEIGLRVAKVTALADDIALNMSVPSVRIVAPIPGRNTVGIEVPNSNRATVHIKETILSASAKTTKSKLPLFLGKDSEGRPLVYDLAEMPHLLIAGRTGTGKSVCLNAVILSLLMTRTPEQVKMILIDPKMLELSEYGRIPHLMHPVVKDMKKAEAILGWAVEKMEERYELLSRARVRNIAGYNELPRDEVLRRIHPADEEELSRVPEVMPYIVIVIDEMGDLMMSHKKEVEGHVVRLAQKSRAAGIHLIVATQKPTVDVITGLIKSNLPARICFQVSSRTDSMVVLDEKGAEKLLGKGDMLFLQPGTSTILRAQGAYASDQEITRVTSHLECEPEFEGELMDLRSTHRGEGGFLEVLGQRDPLYVQAIEVVIREQRGSCSLLQRALGIGYGKAARFIDFMAEDGIVGQYNGSQARQVLYTLEKWEEMKTGTAA